MKPEKHAAHYAGFEYDGEGIVLRFVETFPEFLPLLDEHLDDNGEVLFHVFMYPAIETLGLGMNPPNPERLNAIITFFEHEAAASAGARNEIAVVFEHHPPCSEELTKRLTFGLEAETSPLGGTIRRST